MRTLNESVKVLVAQLCPALCDPVDHSPPGSSILGILQAGILERAAIPFSRLSSRPRDWTWVFLTAGRFFIIRDTREAQHWVPSTNLKIRSAIDNLVNCLRKLFKYWWILSIWKHFLIYFQLFNQMIWYSKRLCSADPRALFVLNGYRKPFNFHEIEILEARRVQWLCLKSFDLATVEILFIYLFF